MTFIFSGLLGLLLEGSRRKIEDKQVPGIYLKVMNQIIPGPGPFRVPNGCLTGCQLTIP